MNKTRWYSVLTAACFAAALGARADEVEVKGKVDTKNNSVDVRKTDREDTTRENRAELRSTVRAANKASGLLGMEVKNNEGEKLGEIKDLVVDLRTGRISYAVLAVGGFLGIGEKLLAVPPSAFTPAGDEHRLVLNADREKIRNAPGFAATSWPEVDNPSWGADGYWTPDKTKGAIVTDRDATIRTDVNAKKAEVNVHTDADRDRTGAKLYADAKKDREARAEANSKKVEVNTSVDTDRNTRRDNARREGMSFEGQIKSVNPEERTLVVEARDGTTKTFNFSTKPHITIARVSDPTISDLKPGFHVEVGYHKDSDGKMIVHRVSTNER